MNHIDFVKLVAQMRGFQKDYFISHSRQALERAKVLERQVDMAVLTILGGLPQQGSLLEQQPDTVTWAQGE